MVAQELALTHPERVDRWVLVATVPGGPRSRPIPLGTTYLFAAAPFLTDKARLQRFIDNALGPATRRRPPEIAERLTAAKLAHPQSQPAWRAQVAAGMLSNPLGRQRRITQPTLVVQGTRPGRGPRQRRRAGRPAPRCPSGAVRRSRAPALLGAAKAVRTHGLPLSRRSAAPRSGTDPSRSPGQLVAHGRRETK
jgi:pimeloyl-ACP methyl ester carboxylesterase